MQDAITERFKELSEQGATLLVAARSECDQWSECIYRNRMAKYQSWISSTLNLLDLIVLRDSYYKKEIDRVLADQKVQDAISIGMLNKIHGLLTSANDEWQHGLLRRIEYVVAAATFDEFLDHASVYHKGNKKVEAAVLSSAVLEDTIKQIARKNQVDPTGLSLDETVDVLIKAGTISIVKGKRIKSYAGVRNHALHAEWEKFDIKDVGEQIAGVRELIEDFL